MPKLNVEKGRAMLNWAGAVLEETVSSFQSLRDGQIFCRMLSIAQRSPEDDYEEYDISKASLDEAYNILEKMFTIEVMEKLDLNLALNGDETELMKFLLLVLALGVKSPLSRCFTAPSLTLNTHNQNLILFVMGHAFKDCRHLHDMAANFYDGLMLDTMDGLHVTPQRIESPMDASTPVTSKVLRKSNFTPGSVAVVCGSPRVNDEVADVPITTMLRMRHHRICQFEQKLTKEKNLRSEIEAELQLKEDLIDSKAEVISKLEDKIIFMEKTAKEMKEDQISYLREMSDLRKAHEEKVMELKCRYESMFTELEEFKARNTFLEKENEDVWKEVHHWRKLQETLEKYKGMEEVLSRTKFDNDELRIKEKHYKRCMEELQFEVQSLSSTLESERECYREKINSVKSQHERSWLPESAECLGNIIEEDLKNKINDLQKQLEEKELASEELERELLMTNSTLHKEIKSLVSERTGLQEINIKSEAKIQLLLYEVKVTNLKVETLENSNTSLESCIVEKMESLNCLRGEMENLKFNLQSKLEKILMLEGNIEELRDDLKASEQSAEDLRHAEALKLKESQELESKYKDLLLLLEVEKTKNSEVEGVLTSLRSERETLLSDVRDLTEKLSSLENVKEMIKAANNELECQLVNKNGVINSLEASLTESNEKFEQLSRESSHSLKQLGCQIQRKVQEIDHMQGEISHLESTLQKVSNELTEKDGLLKKSETLAVKLTNEVQTFRTELMNSENAFASLSSEHLSLNKEVTELKSQKLITEKSHMELINSLKLKSEQMAELQESVVDIEQKLENERALFIEKEEQMKDELQKSAKTHEILGEKCHLLLSKTTEQGDIIQKVTEELNNLHDAKTLNDDLSNKLDEKDQQLRLCLELEANLKGEIQSLKQENDMMKCQISNQGQELNDFDLLKKGYETKLATLENNFRSLQKSSEGDKDFLATQRQLIQKLETKSKDDDLRILELTRKIQENQEEMNKEAKFLASRLKAEIAEKENMRLALETLSDDNLRLHNEFDKMQASHSQNVSTVEVRIRNEVAHESQQLREALREKEEEISNYHRQVEKCQNEEFIVERLQQSESDNQSLSLSLQDAKNALQERQQELDELKTERDALSDEVSRLQKEVDDLMIEVQKNNREMKRLNDELSSSQIMANRMKSSEAEMQQITSLLQDQREILSLSRTSSKTCINKACVKMRQQLEKVQKSDSRSAATAERDLENSLESNSEFDRNACPSFWGQNLEAVDEDENIPPTPSERRHTMGNASEWGAAFPTLPRLNLETAEKEATMNKIPRGLGIMLRTEDEPDHIEWGFLEKVAMKKSTSDTMFGGARRTSLSSVNSNVSLENMNSVPSRKSSLGTSSTTFSSFHPAKQEAFGLHSIAENDQRVEEIRRRNTLCLPHLKSSYALEQLKQVVPDEELKKPVLVKTENQQPSRSSVYNRRKSPRKKFSFSSAVSPSARRMRLKAETPTKRSHRFTVNLTSDKSSQKSDQDSLTSLTSCEESTHKKTKSVAYSIGFTPKKALSKLGFNRKKKDDK